MDTPECNPINLRTSFDSLWDFCDFIFPIEVSCIYDWNINSDGYLTGKSRLEKNSDIKSVPIGLMQYAYLNQMISIDGVEMTVKEGQGSWHGNKVIRMEII